MANEVSWQSAGIADALVSYRNDNGIMNGIANLVAANTNTGSGMRRLYKIDTMPQPSLPPTLVRPRGDNGFGYSFAFASGDIPQVESSFGQADITLDAALIEATNHTLGDWTINAMAPSLPDLTSMVMLAHADAVSTDAATAGLRGFENRLYGNVQMIPLDRESLAFQAEASYRYSIIVNPMSVLPWGGLFSSSNVTLADGLYLRWFSANRTMLHAYVGDNAEDTITVDHTPVSAAKTKAFSLSGTTATPLTVSSVTPSTKAVVLSAAPTSGQLVVIVYEASRLA